MLSNDYLKGSIVNQSFNYVFIDFLLILEDQHTFSAFMPDINI